MLSAVLGLVLSADTLAITASATMTVSADLTTHCHFVANQLMLDFGTYDPIGANALSPLDAQVRLQTQCTKNSSYKITLNKGQYADEYGNYRLKNNNTTTDYLRYRLYLDSARTLVISAPIDKIGRGNEISDETILYARIAAGQHVSVGHYTDNIIVTISY